MHLHVDSNSLEKKTVKTQISVNIKHHDDNTIDIIGRETLYNSVFKHIKLFRVLTICP